MDRPQCACINPPPPAPNAAKSNAISRKRRTRMPLPAILGIPYAVSGTDLGYGTTGHYAVSGTDLGYAATRWTLR
eukprot:3742135-Rhodomonas_salina.2